MGTPRTDKFYDAISDRECPEYSMIGHMLRAKGIIKDFLSWYDNGMRDRRDLDRIYDKASDLFGDQ